MEQLVCRQFLGKKELAILMVCVVFVSEDFNVLDLDLAI